MKRQDTRKISFPLTDEGIDAASIHISTLLEGVVERREALRIRLATEDVLNLWRNTSGIEAIFTVQFCVRPGQRSVRLSAAGPDVNPNTDCSQSELDAAGNIILEGLGLSPMYRYEKGINQVDFRLHKKSEINYHGWYWPLLWQWVWVF